MITLGIDGSSTAGIPDCAALFLAGYRFAIPRISLGHTRDKAAPEYVHRARDAGMLARSGYPYLRTWEEPESQADVAAEVAAELDLSMVWIDVEPAGIKDGKYIHPTDSPAAARELFLRWCERADAISLRWGVYGGAAYLHALNLPGSFAAKPIWLADYTPPLWLPRPWQGYTIWQTAGNVELAGAVVDINETALSLAALELLMTGETWTAPEAVLVNVLRVSDAAMGTAGSPEHFVNRREGPRIGP